MTILILDTCVWYDLAVSHNSLITKISQLIEEDKITVLVPETVLTEWNNLKDKLTKETKGDVIELRRAVKRYESLYIGDENSEHFKNILSIDSNTLGGNIANSRIESVDKILNNTKTIHVPVAEESFATASKLALDKKAPFRKNKNSMADALIFLTAVDWVNSHKPNKSIFVTSNTSDFSNAENINEISTDLLPYVAENKLKYHIFASHALNEIENEIASEDEIQVEENIVERRHISHESLSKIHEQLNAIRALTGTINQSALSRSALDAAEQYKAITESINRIMPQDSLFGISSAKQLSDVSSALDAAEQYKAITESINRIMPQGFLSGISSAKQLSDVNSAYAAAEQLKSITESIKRFMPQDSLSGISSAKQLAAVDSAFELSQRMKKINDIFCSYRQ